MELNIQAPHVADRLGNLRLTSGMYLLLVAQWLAAETITHLPAGLTAVPDVMALSEWESIK